MKLPATLLSQPILRQFWIVPLWWFHFFLLLNIFTWHPLKLQTLLTSLVAYASPLGNLNLVLVGTELKPVSPFLSPFTWILYFVFSILTDVCWIFTGPLFSLQHSVYYILCFIFCISKSVFYILYSKFCILDSVFKILYFVFSILTVTYVESLQRPPIIHLITVVTLLFHPSPAIRQHLVNMYLSFQEKEYLWCRVCCGLQKDI